MNTLGMLVWALTSFWSRGAVGVEGGTGKIVRARGQDLGLWTSALVAYVGVGTDTLAVRGGLLPMWLVATTCTV